MPYFFTNSNGQKTKSYSIIELQGLANKGTLTKDKVVYDEMDNPFYVDELVRFDHQTKSSGQPNEPISFWGLTGQPVVTWIKSNRYLSIVLGVIGFSIVALIFFSSLTYDVYWEKNGVLVRDTYSRWSGKPFRRWVSDDNVWGSGPLTESGKSHGRWSCTNFKNRTTYDIYFWYGEQITEGEWHLRNK